MAAVEVARAYCFQWPQTPLPSTRCAFSPKSMSLAFSGNNSSDRAIAHVHRVGHRVSFLELSTEALQYSHHRRRGRGGRRGVSTTSSLDGFVDGDNDEVEFVKMINELDLKFKLEAESRMNRDAGVSNSNGDADFSSASPVSEGISIPPFSSTAEILAMQSNLRPICDRFSPEKVIDRRANSFDLPVSLRILKRKRKRWETAVMNNYACCSVRKAFSSMVFIVQEILTQTIHMREALFSSPNLHNQGILVKAHDELHASFIWLFQHIFSATPNLMVYLMLLLANFTVFSITQHPATTPPPSQPVSVSVEESENPSIPNDSAAVNTFLIGRSLTVGGNCGGGDDEKVRAIAGAEDDGGLDLSSYSFCTGRTISHDVAPTTGADEQEYAAAWKRILQEAERIRGNERHEALMDPDTLRRFVSPVTVELESEDLSAYSVTELSYRRALAQNPDDPLILSNFAQFLYLVLRDHDSAEEYFKRAAGAAPADAEALCRYANFLWAAKADLETAEETFLAAIAVDPGNSYYSANYAHFLWSTGGEDTCYPLEEQGGA